MQADTSQAEQDMREQLLSMAYAKNTVKAYKSGVEGANGYLQHVHSGPFEAWSEASIAAWLLHALFNLKWKKSTLRNRLSAVAWYAKVVQQQPWQDEPGSFVHLMKRTIDRLGADAEPKRPIKADKLSALMRLLDGAVKSPQLLAELARACPLWRTQAKRAASECAAWFAVTFACFLRASETAALTWDDVQAELRDGTVHKMQISLRTSQFEIRKTETSTVHLVLEAVGREEPLFQISAVYRLSKLLVLCKPQLQGRVFSITVEQARKVFQVLAAAVFRVAPASFGLHSLRSGAACSADEAGKGIARIMFMGRWRSAAVLAYLRADNDGASALLLKGKRPGQDTARGERRNL